MIVIEMNPRVSRSSALASKATGFPIAKVAAKLAVGYTLDEIQNDITGGATPASFEPTIDYVVTKIPRFAFEKFPGAEPLLNTAMKSVGEAMAIGRTFGESLQKALRSLETGLNGLDEIPIDGMVPGEETVALRAALGRPTPDRILVVAQALRHGMSHAEIHEACRFDPWFIAQIQDIVDLEAKVKPLRRAHHGPEPARPEERGLLRRAVGGPGQPGGRADVTAAAPRARRPPRVQAHRHLRGRVRVPHRLHVLDLRAALRRRPRPTRRARPTARRSSSSAAARTASARASSSTIAAATPASRSRDAGYETVMVNCNPETVSTDYDTSDRLYFEPLTAEDVLEVLEVERSRGTAQGRHRAVRRADPPQARQRPAGGRHPDPRHDASIPSTSPRIATASSGCSTRSG